MMHGNKLPTYYHASSHVTGDWLSNCSNKMLQLAAVRDLFSHRSSAQPFAK
jgi:hypothetical protein